MKYFRISNGWVKTSVLSGSLSLLALLPVSAAAQTDLSQSAAQSQDNQSLQQQLEQLRQQVADLQKALQPQSAQKASTGSGMRRKSSQPPMAGKDAPQGMSGMDSMPMVDKPANAMGQGMGDMGEMGSMPMGDMGEMGSMPMGDMGEMGSMPMGDMGEMGSMPTGNMGQMPMDSMRQQKNSNQMPGMRGMGNMGRMKGSSGLGTQSAMPGFPGESHLYHIGATGFFLDHPQHITLTQEQQTRLNQMREKALLNDATAQRRIDQAEQELYAMTGADQPDEGKIQAKVKEIANLAAEKRVAYIRSVGEAAQVLTDQQRQELLGRVPMEMKK